MLRVTGAVLIVLSSTLMGFLEAMRLKKRCEELEKLLWAMEYMENEISYGKRDIKSVVSSIGALRGISLFTTAGENMKTASTKDSFLKALETDAAYLLGTDKEVITGFAENLGLVDAATQIKSIRHTKGLISAQRDEATSEYARSGRLFKSTGVLAGLGAVILLF